MANTKNLFSLHKKIISMNYFVRLRQLALNTLSVLLGRGNRVAGNISKCIQMQSLFPGIPSASDDSWE